MIKFPRTRAEAREHHPRDDAAVSLTGIRPALTLFETWVTAELAVCGSTRRRRLIEQLTDRWLRDELAHGAGTVDAALWAPARIRGEVRALLEELEGDFLCSAPMTAPA
jgi:hypothetical protein